MNAPFTDERSDVDNQGQARRGFDEPGSWAGLDRVERRRWFFSPRASDDPRFDVGFGVVAIIVFFGGFLGWAGSAPLDAAVVAPGAVVVSGYRQAVQHRDGGVVSRILVAEGERVREGQVLVELVATELAAQEQSLATQLIELQLQRAQLAAAQSGANEIERPAEWANLAEEDRPIAEAAFERHLHEMQTRSAVSPRQGAGGEIDATILGLRGQINAVDRQSTLLQQELEGMRPLAEERIIPMPTVRARERALAELEGERARLVAAIGQVQQDRAEEQRRVEARIAEIAPQHAALHVQIEGARLRAPVDGVVVGLSVNTIGGVVRAGERLMDIVPAGEALVIEARVDPRDGESLRVGLNTEIRITAFHGRNLPLMRGTVHAVSADTLVDEHSGQAFYRVEVEVAREVVNAALAEREDDAAVLRPGLPAQVIIPTRRRTALEYLFEPLGQALRTSFRED